MSLNGQNIRVAKNLLVLFAMILIVCLGTSITFNKIAFHGADFLLPLYYGYVLIYLGLHIFQFAFAIHSLKIRFDLLNDNLRFTLQNVSVKPNTVINIHANSFRDRHGKLFTNLYSELCDGIELANETFTFQIIPYMCYYLSGNLFALYSLIRELYYQSPYALIAFILNSSWVVMHTIIIVIALTISTSMTKAAQKTPIIVSSIIKANEFTGCMLETFRIFLMEIQYRNLFAESAFFRIDWKLYLGVSFNFLQSHHYYIKCYITYITLIIDDINNGNIFSDYLSIRRK